MSAGEQQEKRELVLLGQAIRELRERQGLGANSLAAAARVEPGDIAAIEAGRLDPSYDLLLRVADGLGVTPTAIVARAEELLR